MLYGTLKCVFQTVSFLVSWFAQELSGSTAESEGIRSWLLSYAMPLGCLKWAMKLLEMTLCLTAPLRLSHHWSLQDSIGQDHNLTGIFKVHPPLMPLVLFLLLGSFPYISDVLTFSFKTKFKPIFCHECFPFIPTPSLSLSYMILNDTKFTYKFFFYFQVHIC